MALTVALVVRLTVLLLASQSKIGLHTGQCEKKIQVFHSKNLDNCCHFLLARLLELSIHSIQTAFNLHTLLEMPDSDLPAQCFTRNGIKSRLK